MQCLICYKTFKTCSRVYVLKGHFEQYYFNINNLNYKERQEFFNRLKTIFFLEKLKV